MTSFTFTTVLKKMGHILVVLTRDSCDFNISCVCGDCGLFFCT